MTDIEMTALATKRLDPNVMHYLSSTEPYKGYNPDSKWKIPYIGHIAVRLMLWHIVDGPPIYKNQRIEFMVKEAIKSKSVMLEDEKVVVQLLSSIS